MGAELKRILVAALAIVGLAGAVPSQIEAADRSVCAAGVACGPGTSYTTLALAWAASGSGDVIYMKAGETFTASTTLTDKGDLASPITIIGNMTSPPVSGQRASCTTMTAAATATIVSSGGGAPAIIIPIGASDITIKNLRFLNEPNGFAEIIHIGENNTTQQFASEQPEDITVTQNCFDINPLIGQKRGVSMNGRNITVTSNDFNGINGIGQDTQCAVAVNSQGPLTFSNNRCFGGTEGFLTGGDQTFIRTWAAVAASPAPSSTVFTLENFTGSAADAERRAVVIGTGSTTSLIVLSTVGGATASTSGGAYDGYELLFTSGTLNGTRTSPMTGYTGSTTKRGTVTTLGSAPANGDTAWMLWRVQTIATLSVGQLIACDINGTREHSFVTAKSSNQVTVSPAFSQAPATAADCRWGAVPSTVTIERNLFTKDVAWRNPILATPLNVTAVASTTSGSLAAGSACYVVIAVMPGYNASNVYSGESQEVCATLAAPGNIRISWSAVTNATSYRVWGRSSGGQTFYWSVSAPTVTYVDTGSAGTTATKSTQRNTKWQIKNALELKACIDCIVRGNILEYNWYAAQTGFAFLIKTVNQDAGGYFDEFNIIKNVLVNQNVIRHTSGCIVVVGQEYESGLALDKPAPATDITISHNLCYDSNSTWNTGGSQSNYAFSLQNGIKNLTVAHNTIAHSGGGLITFAGPVFLGTNTFTDNVLRANTNGAKAPSTAQGTASLSLYNLGFTYNLLGGITSGTNTWPAAATSFNAYPTAAAFSSALVLDGGPAITDYALAPGSIYATAASDGTMMGADIAALASYLQGVETGAPVGNPSIDTSFLPDGTVGAPYSATLTASGGTGTKTFTLQSGTLPAGLTRTQGVISGTPTTAGTATLTFRATDTQAAFVDRTLTLTIAAAAVPVTIQTATLLPIDTSHPTSTQLVATGGSSAYIWSTTAGTLPPGLLLSTSGLFAGTATAAGTYTFTVRATSGAVYDEQDLSIVVSAGGIIIAPTDPIPRPTVNNGQQLLTFTTSDMPNSTTRVRVKDLWVSDTYALCVITGTSPSTTVRCATPRTFSFHADDDHSTTAANGGSEFGTSGRFRLKADLTAYQECRLRAYVSGAGPSGQTLEIQYDADGGGTWTQLGSSAAIAVTTASTGMKDLTWTTLATGARTDTELRAFFTSGDGADGTSLAGVSMECR